MTVKLDKSGLTKLRANMAYLDQAAVDTGFLGGQMHDDKNTMATVARWQEYGTEKAGKPYIPERPFLSFSFRNTAAIRAQVRRELKLIISNRSTTKNSLDRLGRSQRKRVVGAITNWLAPPNAPFTVKKKGFNNPLIHTGALRGGVKSRTRLTRRRRR